MARIFKALFVLLLALGLTSVGTGCSQSSLSGGNSLTGAKKEKKETEPNDAPKGDEEDPQDGEGVDAPVWVNASYLTCVPEAEHSTKAEVAVRCTLDSEEGPVKPDGSTVTWVTLDKDGDEIQGKGEELDSDERYVHRFLFPGKFLAKRGVGVKFNGGSIAAGKTLQMAEAIQGLSDDGELAQCLGQADFEAKTCIEEFAEADSTNKKPAAPLTKVRLFVLNAMNTGMLGGIAGADGFCDSAAKTAKLNGKFRALLSSSAQDAIDVVPANLPIVDVADSLIAQNREKLFDGNLENAKIVRTETGAVIGDSIAWTGSRENGRRTGYNCKDWTTNATTAKGTGGRVGKAGEDWIYIEESPGPCTLPAHLYCVEIQ